MIIKLSKKVPVRRKVEQASTKFIMHLPMRDKVIVENLIARMKRLKPNLKIGKSYVFRQGARMFCRQQNLLLSKVEKGQYHAKKRKQN